MKKEQKMPELYACDCCDFLCSKKSNFVKHKLTRKHLKNANLEQIEQKNAKKMPEHKPCEFLCNTCKKSYKARNSLWYHEKKCNEINSTNIVNIVNNNEDNKDVKIKFNNDEIIQVLMKQNNEFKEMLIEQNNKIMELAKEGKYITNNNSNTTNNNFNLNLFLNEKCKNAINIMDFINTLQVQLQDLENTGKLGYVQGITRIFIRGLLELDVYKRPIHCSDLKRETLYVKDKDVWEKEDKEKGKIKLAIKYIADKNMRQLSNWVKENPESKDIESKKHIEYMKIINKLTGGMTTDEDEDNYNKIIKNVSKEVVIGKDTSNT